MLYRILQQKALSIMRLFQIFRNENYYRGLDQASDLIFKAAAGEYKAPQNYGKKRGPKGIGFGAIILFIILLFLFSGRGGGRGGGKGGGMISRRGYGDIGTAWILGSLLGGSGRGGGAADGLAGVAEAVASEGLEEVASVGVVQVVAGNPKTAQVNLRACLYGWLLMDDTKSMLLYF